MQGSRLVLIKSDTVLPTARRRCDVSKVAAVLPRHNEAEMVPQTGCGGGITRPLLKDGGAEELRGDPTVGPHPKVWTIGQE